MNKKIKKKIINGDTVIIVSGKDSGKIGKVLGFKYLENTIKVLVEGCCVVTKHVKPTNNAAGQLLNKERYIDISNVAFYDIKSGLATKIGYKFIDGKKVRFLKSTQELIN